MSCPHYCKEVKKGCLLLGALGSAVLMLVVVVFVVYPGSFTAGAKLHEPLVMMDTREG
jgi:hypothetical protein